jgi:hypothetical protein
MVWRDDLSLTRADLNGAELIITNPPFDRSRKLMHAMIDHLPTLAPCWSPLPEYNGALGHGRAARDRRDRPCEVDSWVDDFTNR